MVSVSVLYPKTDGSHFDYEYYLQKHVPMVRSRCQPLGLSRLDLIRGISTLNGGQPGFELIGILTFESKEQMQSALAQAGEEILSDIPNFTNISPYIQLNDLIS